MVLKEQVDLVKKSVALTQELPGITALLIVSSLVSNYFMSLQENFFKDSLFLRGAMVLLLYVAALYFEAGCYFVLSSKVEPLDKKVSFFIAAKRYFPSLLLIGFYIFLIFLLFMISFFYLIDTLAGYYIDSCKTAFVFASKGVALVTIYVIPILYTYGSRGLESFSHAFIFLWDNLDRTTGIFMIIVAEALLWVPFVFIPSHFHWPIWSTLFAFLYEFISSYLGAVIFLIAVQLLKDEVGRGKWALA